MGEIYVESLVSSRTKKGMVAIMLSPAGGESVSVQLTPDQAREIGTRMIEVATVAVDDEMLHEFAGPNGVVAMRELRKRRQP